MSREERVEISRAASEILRGWFPASYPPTFNAEAEVRLVVDASCLPLSSKPETLNLNPRLTPEPPYTYIGPRKDGRHPS